LDNENRPTHPALPIKMILYYAREAGSIAAAVAPILTDTDGAVWRHCFSTISLLGANLTEAQDQYHMRHEEVSWNLGPNMQFYRMLDSLHTHADSGSQAASMMYYMEGDSIPIATNWLDQLATEIEANQPFSVLGGRYAGCVRALRSSCCLNTSLCCSRRMHFPSTHCFGLTPAYYVRSSTHLSGAHSLTGNAATTH
jgi:hypothetical protein